jgi:uncharacterized repeat protein (TIGR01451 family)
MKLIRTSLVALALCFGTAVRGTAQDKTQQEWNGQYRDSYEVPLGNYGGKSPFMSGMAKPAAAKPAPAPAPVAKAAPAPKPAPAPAPAPAPVPAPKALSNSAETTCGLVKLQKTAPSVAAIGENITYTLNAVAQCNVGDVVITDTLPAGCSYVSSEPAAEVNGKVLTWKFATLNQGEAKAAKITVKADAEGELVNCATVTAIPRVCVSTLVGKPVLAITKTGPATALLGADVTYTVTVMNKGNITAKNVVVTDAVPSGLSGNPVTVNVGDLAPGASKTLPVTFKTTQRGKVCNTAVADSSNAGKVNAEACTLVQQPGVKIVKSTTDKKLLINRTATYTINVQNTGDTTLTGVVVSDAAAAGTTIVEAVGGSIGGSTATWNVGELAAGASKDLTVKINSKTPGNYCNTASVSTTQGLKDSSQACTEWIGVTGVLVEVVDDPDPIQVGETSTYTITVKNQSTSGTVDELDIVANFPAEISPVSASNSGAISGKTVTFPRVVTLAPKQSVTYTIIGKAEKAGDARLKVEVKTRSRQNPIEEAESTTVY